MSYLPVHWFYLFFHRDGLEGPCQLSFRLAKPADETAPPQWVVEPVTRVANAVVEGAQCAPGITWAIGAAAAPFAGFLTLKDMQFGEVAETPVYQLVPILDAQLAGRDGLMHAVLASQNRMLGVPPSA